MFGSTQYERLKDLHIGAMLTTGATASCVVRSSAFRQLTVLSYRDDQRTTGTGANDGATTKFVNELIQLSEPPRLQKLDLSENRLTEEPLVQLLAAPILSTVEDLDLSTNNLGAEGIRAIAAAHLPNLRSLRLSRTRPGESGIRSLCDSGSLSELRSLSLSGNNLYSPVRALRSGSEALANLRVLDLSENRLGDEGVMDIAQDSRRNYLRTQLRNLAHLDLSENQIGDVGADALMNSPHLESIVFLNLSKNNISAEVAARLEQRFGERVLL
jgi:Leucine-rich repeat (LRR) protein